MPILVPFRFLAHSRAWRLGRWGCGERKEINRSFAVLQVVRVASPAR
ncbi:hypothetical protein [Escherichia coli]|nr:hypothetical protein [Escherichia coli]